MPSMPMPQGMTQEVIQYVTEIIRLNLAFNDNDTLRGEMDSREQLQLKKMQEMIDGEVGSVKQMTDHIIYLTSLLTESIDRLSKLLSLRTRLRLWLRANLLTGGVK